MELHTLAEKAAARIAGRAVGALFFTFFGSILLEVWAYRSGAGLKPAIIIGTLGLTLLAYAWLRYRRHAPALAREADTPERVRANRVFHIVNAAQWVTILVLGNVLANLGHGDWVVPMAIMVIGLHFVPLAHVFGYPMHYVTAFSMVAFAILYPLLAHGGLRDPVGFLGTGLILWLSAALALRRIS